MVGVAGRSKGCKTCRKRKKGGYARQWTFIANEPVARGDATAVVARWPVAKSPPLRFLPDELNRTAFEAQSVGIFWNLYYPASERFVPRTYRVGIDYRNWITAVQKLDLNDTALRSALLAFCLARIGTSHNDQAVSQQGLKLYGTALKEMNRALRDNKRVQTDEILAAGKLMAGYEVLKTLLIITAIVSRKPNFFATLQWRTLPFEGKTKDVSNGLHDIMATLPGLLEEFDLIRVCPDETTAHERRLELFRQCRATDESLRRWYADLSSRLPKPLPSVIRSPAEQEGTLDQDCFPFEVSDHILAITLALYWTTCLLLHGLIHMLFDALRLSGLTSMPKELPDHIDPHRFAISITRSIGYFIRPEMGIWGVQLISYPLGVALMYCLTSDDADVKEERRQLGIKIAAMSDMGLSLGTFLTSLQAASVPWIVSDESEDPWRARSQLWFRSNPRSQA
ncbi:MAG: hypothetical protein Q9186_006849 [Xanthomendoza sp. 1 TL-2023]